MANQKVLYYDVTSKTDDVKRPCMTSPRKLSILMHSNPHAHKTMMPPDATEQCIPSLTSHYTVTGDHMRHSVVRKEDTPFVELDDNIIVTRKDMPNIFVRNMPNMPECDMLNMPGCDVSVIRYETIPRENPTNGEFLVEEGVHGGAETRPSSSTSNFSELDSGFDELRATSVTPSSLVEDVMRSGGSHSGVDQLLSAEESTTLVVHEQEQKKYKTQQLECLATIEQLQPSCRFDTMQEPHSDSSKSSGEELLSLSPPLSPYVESDTSLNYSHSENSSDCVQPSYDHENNDPTQNRNEMYCQETVEYLNNRHDAHRTVGNLNQGQDAHSVNSFAFNNFENLGEISVSHPRNVTGEQLDGDDNAFDDMDTGGRRASLRVECYSSRGNMSTSPNTNGSHFKLKDCQNQSNQSFIQHQSSFNLSNSSEPQLIHGSPVRNASDCIQNHAMKGAEHQRQFLWQPWNKSSVDLDRESVQTFNPTVKQRNLSLQEVVHNTAEVNNEEGRDRLGILRLRKECGVWKSEMTHVTRPTANGSLKVLSENILTTKPNEENDKRILPANFLSIPHVQPCVIGPSDNLSQFNEPSDQKYFRIKNDFNLIPHSSALIPNGYQSESSSKGVRRVPVLLNQFNSHQFSSVQQSTPYRPHDQTASIDLRQSWRDEHKYSEARLNTFPDNNCVFNHSQKMQYASPGLLIPAIEERSVSVSQSAHVLMTSLPTGYRNLNPFAVYLMSEWFDKNSSNPYPSAEVKAHLANSGGISVTQVASWFNHRRTREKRKLHLSDGSGENGLGLEPVNKRLKLDNDS